MSIHLLFLAVPFIVRERREFAALIGALALATGIGGLRFLSCQPQPAFPPHGDPGIWAGLSRFADWLNLDDNMAPSLHVALSVCCVAIFFPARQAVGARAAVALGFRDRALDRAHGPASPRRCAHRLSLFLGARWRGART